MQAVCHDESLVSASSGLSLSQVFATDEHLVIVMDYASVGHLSERIATGGPLDEGRAKEMFRQLADGMAYCHK